MNGILRIGSIVRLNSGGPTMTVELIEDDGLIRTVWFVNEIIHRDSFTKEELGLVEFFVINRMEK